MTKAPKTAQAPTDRTWAKLDSADQWLKRNPQPGLVVTFTDEIGAYHLAPAASMESQVPEADDEVFEVDMPQDETLETPTDITRSIFEEAAEDSDVGPVAPPEPSHAPESDPTLTVTEQVAQPMNRECELIITGLPMLGDAVHWATEMARKLGYAIVVRVIETGEILATIDTAYLDALKAKRAANAAKAKADKASKQTESGKDPKAAPEGKTLEAVELCMRPQGASPKELIALTGWTKAPWKWTLGNNSKGTGLSDRYGYVFRSEKVDGEVRYFLSIPAEAQAEAA